MPAKRCWSRSPTRVTAEPPGPGRAVVVSDHGNVIDVDAAGQDVGGHEHVDARAAEVLHHLVAAVLLEV